MPDFTFPSNQDSQRQTLFDLIQKRLALTLDEHRQKDLLMLVGEMIASREIISLQDMIRLLSDASTRETIWQTIIRIATIGETYFFRDRDQLNALQVSILPALIQERRSQGNLQLRLWSAGCSTGEEPYSLAMILREMIPDIAAWNIHILATDLNMSNLERAYAGTYRAWSFRSETPDSVRLRWFTEDNGTFRLDRSIRSMVTFTQLNLNDSSYPSLTNGTCEMDVVICRNVLIYFDGPTGAAVVERFNQALRPNGWLILGHSESAHVMNQNFENRNFTNAVVFQKSVASAPKPPFTVELDSLFTPLPAIKPLPTRSSQQTGSLSANRSTSRTPQKPTSRLNDFLSQTPSNSAVTPDGTPMEMARRAADKEQWEQALKHLAEAEKQQLMNPEIHYLRGMVEIQQNKVDQALNSLRRAIYCDQNFALAHFALGEVHEKLEQYKKASFHWTQAQIILSKQGPNESVAFSDELTVEMLSRLLKFRLDRLIARSQS